MLHWVCSKWKFPAMRHLLTPSMEIFRLVIASCMGCGGHLSHTLMGWPHGDPHTALVCCPGLPGLPRHQAAADPQEKLHSIPVLPGVCDV